MTNKILMFFFQILLLVISASCLPFGSKTNLLFKKQTTPFQIGVIPDVVTFAYLKKAVLAPHCISCHKEMGDEQKLNWWIVKGNPEESDLFFWMEDGSMPPDRPATTQELEVVRRYIEQMVE